MTHLLFALTLAVLGLNIAFGFPIPWWEPAALSLIVGSLVVMQHIGAHYNWQFLSGLRLYAA